MLVIASSRSHDQSYNAPIDGRSLSATTACASVRTFTVGSGVSRLINRRLPRRGRGRSPPASTQSTPEHEPGHAIQGGRRAAASPRRAGGRVAQTSSFRRERRTSRTTIATVSNDEIPAFAGMTGAGTRSGWRPRRPDPVQAVVFDFTWTAGRHREALGCCRADHVHQPGVPLRYHRSDTCFGPQCRDARDCGRVLR